MPREPLNIQPCPAHRSVIFDIVPVDIMSTRRVNLGISTVSICALSERISHAIVSAWRRPRTEVAAGTATEAPHLQAA